MSKQKLNKLSDVQVDTVGLVSLGANQEVFFLLKSMDNPISQEDDPMSSQVIEETQSTEVEKVDEAVESAPATPAIDKEALREVLRELLAERGNVEKGADAVDEAATEEEEADQTDGEKEELAKANDDLRTRLEKAEQDLQAEREQRELQSLVVKAADLKIPAKPEDVAEQLFYLQKADPARAQFWFDLLAAISKQIQDGSLFAEFGSSQTPSDVTITEEIERLAKSGDAGALKNAILSMHPDKAAQFLRERRKAMKQE